MKKKHKKKHKVEITNDDDDGMLEPYEKNIQNVLNRIAKFNIPAPDNIVGFWFIWKDKLGRDTHLIAVGINTFMYLKTYNKGKGKKYKTTPGITGLADFPYFNGQEDVSNPQQETKDLFRLKKDLNKTIL